SRRALRFPARDRAHRPSRRPPRIDAPRRRDAFPCERRTGGSADGRLRPHGARELALHGQRGARVRRWWIHSSSFMEFSLADLGGEPPTLESITARFPTPESLHRAMRTASIGRISVSNGTLEEFCRALEQTLDRPVVDETRRGEARPRAGRRTRRPRRAPPQRAGTRADARPSVGALDRRPRERLIRRTLELRSGAVRRFPG